MNKMEQVANILGVELGEKFDVISANGEELRYNPYVLTENGISDKYHSNVPSYLEYILTGKYTIKKAPWKPKEGECYYYIDTSEGKFTVKKNINKALILTEKNRIKALNYFKTNQEAEKALKCFNIILDIFK